MVNEFYKMGELFTWFMDDPNFVFLLLFDKIYYCMLPIGGMAHGSVNDSSLIKAHSIHKDMPKNSSSNNNYNDTFRSA